MLINKPIITRRSIVTKVPEIYSPPLSIFDDALIDASTILTQLITVDGTGSGLDADLLDGVHLADIWSLMPTASTTIKGGIILGAGLTHVGGGVVSVTSGIPAPHSLIDVTNHTVSGLVTGHFLKATGATTYGFGVHGLTYSDVNAVGISGTPVDNQIAIWTSASVLEGLANITYTPGSPGVFHIDGDIIASGEISAFSGSAPTNWWDSMPHAAPGTWGAVLPNGTVTNFLNGLGEWSSVTSGTFDHSALTSGLAFAGTNHTGFQGALTFGIADTNSVVINAADIADNDYAKFTVYGLEGRSYSEVLSDIGAQAVLTNPVTGTGADNQITVFTGTSTVEGTANITYTPGTPHAVFHIEGDITASGEISAFSGSAPVDWWDSMPVASTTVLGGVKIDGTTVTIAGGVISVAAGGGMVYPGAGIALSTGSAWGTSITDNSANWNTAYGWGNHAAYGNISTSGAIGSTANLPIITTTSGVLTTGSFGSGANTFCVGNDYRLSDARTPVSHNNTYHSETYITSAALSPYAPLASPTFTGTVVIGSAIGISSTGVAGKLTINTGGAGTFSIINEDTGSLNVGIQTASPDATFEVAGGVLIGDGYSDRLYFYNVTDNALGIQTLIDGELIGTCAGSANNKLVLNPLGGCVGIGTTNTTGRLSVVAPAASSSMTLNSTTGIGFSLKPADDTGYGLHMGVYSNGNVWIQSGRTSGGATAYNLSLQASGGNVGIGTTEPANQLEVAKLTGGGSSYLRVSSVDNGNYGLIGATTNSIRFYARTTANGNMPMKFQIGTNDIMTISETGVDIGVGTLSVGTVNVTGEVTAYYSSDERLKYNVKSFKALDIIDKLNPKTFQWNDTAKELNSSKDDRNNYGIIAQELEEVLPELIHDVYTDYKAVDYIQLISILIQAVKELKNEVK